MTDLQSAYYQLVRLGLSHGDALTDVAAQFGLDLDSVVVRTLGKAKSRDAREVTGSRGSRGSRRPPRWQTKQNTRDRRRAS